MRILLLCEGDANTRDSWSGTSKSILDHLLADGHTVYCGDVDLYGIDRLLTAGRTFALDRRRWSAKFHLARSAFARRSRAAARHIAAHRHEIDLILQFGATFRPVGRGHLPYVLYCDGNIVRAQQGAAFGPSDAVFLTERELERVREREATVYREASMVLTMSERLRRSFVEDFRVPESRTRTIYAGPNFDIGEIPGLRPQGARTKPTILFIGRQFERKGGDVLLASFTQVRAQIPSAKLVIIGPQGLEIDQPGVECHGFLDKGTEEGRSALHKAYAEASVFCMPTRFEPFGVVFVEAMFFGLPCVSAVSPWGYPEMIADGETGCLVPLDDVQALAQCLVGLLGDPARTLRMGQAGRRRAESLFTWEGVTRRMVEALEPIVRP